MTMIEPTLDDLLDDEIMASVMRSSGIDAAQLKARLSETARKRARNDGHDGDAEEGPGRLAPPPSGRACHLDAACCSA